MTSRYGVHFHVEELDSEELQRLEKDALGVVASLRLPLPLHLPAPNKYVPYSLQTWTSSDPPAAALPSASTRQLNQPAVLATSPRGLQLLHTTDHLFGHPRSALFLLLGLHNATRSEENAEGRGLVTPYTARQSQLNRLTSKFYARLHAVGRYPSALAGLQHSVTWWKR